LLLAGGSSAPFMPAAARRLAEVIPHATVRVLDDQTHDIVPAVLVPQLRDFF
jgi:hypothetical protein